MKGLLTLILTLAICLSGTAQGWIRDLGNQDGASAYAVVQTPDGGYAAAGQWAGANPQIWRTDADGNTLWHTVFPDVEFGFGTDIALTSDGGFAITDQKQPAGFSSAPSPLLARWRGPPSAGPSGEGPRLTSPSAADSTMRRQPRAGRGRAGRI